MRMSVPAVVRQSESFWEVQALEQRRYLSAPVLDSIAPQIVPAGKTIQVPLTATDIDGNPLHYTVASDNPGITVSLHPTTNTWLRLSTTQGVMLFQLFNDIAPNTVATMTGLVNSGYFNGQKFYAIAKSGGQPYYIAGGSPTGTHDRRPRISCMMMSSIPNAIFSNPGVLAMLNLGGAKTPTAASSSSPTQPVRVAGFQQHRSGASLFADMAR